MNGILLKFYMHENRKHGHTLLYEWLIEEAKKLGISGGSVFRGIAGFGRNGILHEQHFLELAGDVPLAVEFLANDEDAEKLLKRLTVEKISIAYAKIPAVIGSIEGND
jgi:PII-like signaling protein